MSKDVLYTQQDCGCLALVLVDEPQVLRDCAKDVARELRKGRSLKRIDIDSFRAGNPGLRCPEHKREAAERAGQQSLAL